MPHSTDIRIVSAQSSTMRIAYRTPMKFGGRVVTDVMLMDVVVDVETHDGRRGRGHGSMPMGNVWAWPIGAASSEARLAAMIGLAELAARRAAESREFGHALELTHVLSQQESALAADVMAAGGLNEPMPRLAQLVATS